MSNTAKSVQVKKDEYGWVISNPHYTTRRDTWERAMKIARRIAHPTPSSVPKGLESEYWNVIDMFDSPVPAWMRGV